MSDNSQDIPLIGDDANAIVNDPAGLNALSGTPAVPDSSNLPVVSNQGPADPTAATVAQNNANGTDAAGESDMNDATSGAADGAQGGSGSMWQRILQGALAGLAGQTAHGRSSIVNGIIGGAKGEEVAQQQQQENDRANAELQSNIKFRNLQSAQMLATAARQDKELAMSTDEHNDAHDKNAMAKIDWLQSHGVDGDIIPNTHAATTNALQNASAASPDGVNVPPGLVHGSDFVFIPKGDTGDVNSEYKQVSDLSTAMGMPAPSQSQFQNISQAQRDSMRQGLLYRAGGYDQTGALLPAAQLPQQLSLAKSALTAYQSSPTADPATVKLMQTRIANMQQQSDDIDNHLANQEKQKELAKQNTPQGQATLAKTQAETAKANEANNPNAEWRPKVTADEKKKAELAENIAENASAVKSIIARRPDLIGTVSGRFTNVQQMMGNNDPDISALGTRIHNIAMANSGVHGFRSQEGVKDTEGLLFNQFKNGPKAVSGALDASTSSVQTFIDNARPDNYRTHSQQGGAANFYVQQQPGDAQGAAGKVHKNMGDFAQSQNTKEAGTLYTDDGKTWYRHDGSIYKGQ